MIDPVLMYHPARPPADTLVYELGKTEWVERAAYRAQWYPLGWRSDMDPGFVGDTLTPAGLTVPGDLVVGGDILSHQPVVFWQNLLSQTLANNTWTPIMWSAERTTIGNWYNNFAPNRTTIAVGSNGQVLPQGTINAVDTTAFATSGQIAVRASGGDTLVTYTGKTATTFTGCTGGSGTMSTGGQIMQATAITAGSNGAVLPQGTINVGSTTGFTTAGYFSVQISGTDRVIQYTGKTSTTFTGCTFGVGTLATNQMVIPALVEFIPPDFGLSPIIAELAWASNATGVRGTRLKALGGFPLNGGTDVRAAFASTDPLMRTIALEQPGGFTPNRIEGYQSSGGNLDTVVEQFAAPRLVMTLTTDLL